MRKKGVWVKEKYFRYIHPEFIKCIADKNDELVAFCITMPSFTRALKKVNGKMFPFGFFHLFKALYFDIVKKWLNQNK